MLDCSMGDLAAEEFAQVRAALFEHGVVVFRGQHLTPDVLVQFLRNFGQPCLSRRASFRIPGYPEIGKVGNARNADGSPAAFLDPDGDIWHSDTAGSEDLHALSMQYCIKTPRVGGDLFYLNSYRAYETLAPALRAKIDGRNAVFNYGCHARFRAQRNPSVTAALDSSEWKDSAQPIIQKHPATSRSLCYLSPTFVKRIEGYGEKESRLIVEEFIAHATQERFVYRHVWREHDLVLWDSLASMHKADAGNYEGDRLMYRGSAIFSGPQS